MASDDQIKNNANHFYNSQFDANKYKSASKGQGLRKRKAYYSDGSDALANIKKQVVSFLHVPSDNSVFFKAFITSYNETYNSTWRSEQVFGRADQIHSFVQTGRQINLSLMVPAASESEAFENLSKVQTLTQFLYPNYTNVQQAQTISQGPLIRLKVMNLLQNMKNAGSTSNADAKMSESDFFNQYRSRGPQPHLGQLGFISSFTVNHNIENRDAGVFEKIEQKVDPETGAIFEEHVPNTILPKNIEIVISFTPIHEHPLGWGSTNRFGTSTQIVSGRYNGELFPYGVVTSSPATDEKFKNMSEEEAIAEAQKAKETQQQKDNAEARYGGMFGKRRQERDLRRYNNGKIKNEEAKKYIESSLRGAGRGDELQTKKDDV